MPLAVPPKLPAVDLLRAWLRHTDRTQPALASELGCHVSLVQQWMGGKRRPSYELAAALERLTEGAVPMSAWADPSVL